MEMPGRKWVYSDFRFAMSGMEKTDEIYGGSYNFGARVLDSRIGRWFTWDLFRQKYPGCSPYNYALNSPITLMDPDGNDVIGGSDFMKRNSNLAAFKIFTESETGRNFVKQFASNNGNLFTSSEPGKLSKHNLYFDTKAGNGDYGLTTLKIIDSKGKAVNYKNGMKVDENTKFQINIGINLGYGSMEGDAGYSAGVINHEVFAHADAFAQVLSLWEDRENNGMTVEQLKKSLDDLDGLAEKEHDNLKAGKVENFNKAVKEILNNFKNHKQTSEAAQAEDEKQFIKVSEEDAPGSTKETE